MLSKLNHGLKKCTYLVKHILLYNYFGDSKRSRHQSRPHGTEPSINLDRFNTKVTGK